MGCANGQSAHSERHSQATKTHTFPGVGIIPSHIDRHADKVLPAPPEDSGPVTGPPPAQPPEEGPPPDKRYELGYTEAEIYREDHASEFTVADPELVDASIA